MVMLMRVLVNKPIPRAKKKTFNPLDWENFLKRDELFISRALRMKPHSFNKLVRILTPLLTKKGYHHAISPKVRVFIYLHFARGVSYLEICHLTGISTASCYRIVHSTCRAILECKHPEVDNIHFPQTLEECRIAAAGFENISYGGIISNCIAAIDGYLLKTRCPSKNEVGNVRAFFSGHYQCFGMNVQAACDAHCRFLFIGIAAPGVMPDRDAVNKVSLGKLVENLPDGFVAIADAAYTATEHMCALFYGYQAKKEENDAFNFYASQCRIRIEMAFGLMTMKWELLQKPLKMKMNKIKLHLTAIARLHNFVINERLNEKKGAFESAREAREAVGTCTPATLNDRRGNPIDDEAVGASVVQPSPLVVGGNSQIRAFMVRKVKARGLKRPVKL